MERGRTVDSVIRQYVATVKPMYEMYVRGYAANADIILPNTDINVKPVDMVIHYVNNRMRAAADPPQG
ncbi:Uridine kinase [bioreactor metagenome]|uniref:Uridine kinase n=1 Tax=bioreactor metagenome TaxID=1076179 RepID=A0A644ZSB4_9ZZZZ